MQLRILTPEKKVFEGDVEKVTIPTRSGYITVLSNHAPLVSATTDGEIKIFNKEGQISFIAERGVVETKDNITSMLLRSCRAK
jgi:F-type H+-transporting ATPase subunit epsilon